LYIIDELLPLIMFIGYFLLLLVVSFYSKLGVMLCFFIPFVVLCFTGHKDYAKLAFIIPIMYFMTQWGYVKHFF